jgi:hypothetical protein
MLVEEIHISGTKNILFLLAIENKKGCPRKMRQPLCY